MLVSSKAETGKKFSHTDCYMLDQADFEDLLLDPPSEKDLERQSLGWDQRLVDDKKQILYLYGKAGCDGWELGDVQAYNGGDCTHSIMPANREEAFVINLLACRFTVVQEWRLVQPEEDGAATLSALLDTADPNVNCSMKDLFGSDSDNEELGLIAQQLQGSDDVRAALVGPVLVNQFNPSSEGAEVVSFDLDALLMSLEIEKVESELIKLFPDLAAEYTTNEVMAALGPYLEDGRIAIDNSSGHVKVYNIYLVSYD